LGGFTGTLMPGQLPIPLCICSSSVVFPHSSGAGSAAPSSNARFHREIWCQLVLVLQYFSTELEGNVMQR
jgi:hypothetical protein